MTENPPLSFSEKGEKRCEPSFDPASQLNRMVENGQRCLDAPQSTRSMLWPMIQRIRPMVSRRRHHLVVGLFFLLFSVAQSFPNIPEDEGDGASVKYSHLQTGFTDSPSESARPSMTPVPTGLTGRPSSAPVRSPTNAPVTPVPSLQPTSSPVTPVPSAPPTIAPVTPSPSGQPTNSPVMTPVPSFVPSTLAPVAEPTDMPVTASPSTPFPTSDAPTTSRPSFQPSTNRPSSNAPTTSRPSLAPSTEMPSSGPTVSPSTSYPTTRPSFAPSTAVPSSGPTSAPSGGPTASPSTSNPTLGPSFAPSTSTPSSRPTFGPTNTPTFLPTTSPTFAPSENPTPGPTFEPSSRPTSSPSAVPSRQPSQSPSSLPSSQPSVSQQPSRSQLPSAAPTPVYEFDNQILRLRGGQSIISGATARNETAGNGPNRFLQTSEIECDSLWSTYVESGIEGEIDSIIPTYETLDIEVGNISKSFDVEQQLLTFFFDVTVAIRSPLREHFLNRYVAGPFDSQAEQADFVLYLQGTGCPEFSSASGVLFDLPTPANRAQSGDSASSAQTGLIAGLVAALAAASVLVGIFLFARNRRDPSSLALEEQAIGDLNASNERNDFVSEVGVRTNQDVSTLGDPIPFASGQQVVDASTDSVSLDYDFQKAYVQPPSTLSERSNIEYEEDFSQLLTDDDMMDKQYITEERIEVSAPQGVLGLVLETNVDGIPVVHAIKSASPLIGTVQIGDRLISVDDNDVSVMLATEVSKLIASKRDQSTRRFVFTRVVRK